MIVCRKPKLYDVDVYGALAVLVLVAAGWFFAVEPWQRIWTSYQDLSVAHTDTAAAVREDMVILERHQRKLEELEQVVEAQVAEVPRWDAMPRLLREVTDIAARANLEVHNVVPLPAATQGPYMVSDVSVGGRGTSGDFVRFLDLLAEQNQFQSLQACRMTRHPGPSDAACDLTWTVRMYLLPEAGLVMDEEDDS